MSVFIDIPRQYAITDDAFADAEQQAFHANDDIAFDNIVAARQRNDQAYFLYLFTRFEAEINAATTSLLAARTGPSSVWAERRVWQAWSRVATRDISLLSKVEVLTDKGRQDYAWVREYYEGRNTIAHGDHWQTPFLVPNVAQTMHDLVQRFVTV